MANLVVHFEIHASEPQRLVDFYSQLLGWKFTQFGDTPYWTIETGEGAIGNVAGTAGHGINGGLTQRRGPKPDGSRWYFSPWPARFARCSPSKNGCDRGPAPPSNG